MEYVFYKVFVSLGKAFARLPMRGLYVISDFLYPFTYYIIKYRRNVVYENLRNSFPEKTDKEIEQIAKKFYRHFCDLLVETVKLLHIKRDELISRFKIKDNSLIVEDFKQKKHIIGVLGHYNNWEWGISIGMQVPHAFASIYKPLTNKYVDGLMIRLRTQFGGETIPMKQTARVFTKYIQEGKLSMVNFISDQSPYKTEIQYWTTFLNQETPVFMGVEKFAKKTRQPVYFFRIIKVRRGFYEVEAEKLCDDCNSLSPNEITEMHVRALEKLIQQAPEYWLWTHRRWKNKKENVL
jgi:Kdo2-lipid IVA lauroyltransferase/acyltransferase